MSMKEEQDTVVLKALEDAIHKNETWLQQAAQTILNEEVSNYPILVAYPNTTNVDIGLMLMESERYTLNITTLEELAMKKIVDLNKINEFRTLYKQHKNSFCVFSIDVPKPQFVFVPYLTNVTE